MEIPRRELTGQEIYNLVDALHIPDFRGVFCADEIPPPPPPGLQQPWKGRPEDQTTTLVNYKNAQGEGEEEGGHPDPSDPPDSGEPFEKECGILNFQNHTQGGSHWTAWYKNGKDIVYYDSYGEIPPPALSEYLNPYGWIKRSVVITQQGPTECGGLCLYVLQALTRGQHYGQILEKLVHRKTSTPLIATPVYDPDGMET